MFEMVAPHSTSRREAAHGRELLHAGAGRPGPRRRGLVATLDRDCVGEPLDTSRTRSSLVGVADEVPPSREFDASSTCQTVSPVPTPAVRKQPSSNSCSARLEARREDHVHLPAVVHWHRPRAVSCPRAAKLKDDVVLRVVVAARESTLVPLPSDQWKPCAWRPPRRRACARAPPPPDRCCRASRSARTKRRRRKLKVEAEPLKWTTPRAARR